ncbi:type II toxin-antitoxin system PemK/MazF family toxin [Pseudoflavonifractor sp. 60]|uniref:DUF6551 family protein n=1 Tax=Pseudoflavonifractor sp. 60 TaxID=2304576 RepID=UPI001370FB00|nr:DUF6551 family protein [Pseudoflavonifractor sp. 60]NBI69277.1 type II toxin-antitoxin system PemK/MazF family toxin [Pseudoflavonifractor sp. 60]
MNGTKRLEKSYEVMFISSSDLSVTRDTYQRELNSRRVREIAESFDERVANEPKVSARDGRFYVFDGQHTMPARKLLNGGRDLPILCKVYTGLTEQDEAVLFAEQTGISAKVYPGSKIRALVFGGDPDAIAFVEATESAGLHLSFNQSRGLKHIGCVAAAYGEFMSAGADLYTEALRVIAAAWDGHKYSLRAETIQGVTEFIKLYHDEYNPKRLISRCRRYDPMHIYRRAKAAGDSLPAPQRYIFEVWNIYNGTSRANTLPLKF